MADTLKTVRPAAVNVNQRHRMEETQDIASVPLPPLKPHAPPPAPRLRPDEVQTQDFAALPLPIADARAEPPEGEPTFTRGPARRPQPRVSDPLLQWASGLTTNDRRIYAGWLVEADKDADLDAAMGRANVAPIAIKHGSGNVVTHWALPTASLFVLCDGVQSIGEMKQTTDRYGIAFGWRAVTSYGSAGGRVQSQLRMRVMLRELLAVGYDRPLLLTLKGTLTGDLLAALTRQYDVLDACARLRAAAGTVGTRTDATSCVSASLPFYAFSIPLGPGAEVTRGSGNATKEITPIVAILPAAIGKEYLLAHWMKRPWVQAIEPLLDATIAWSVAESAQIAAGAEEKAAWERNGGEGDVL